MHFVLQTWQWAEQPWQGKQSPCPYSPYQIIRHCWDNSVIWWLSRFLCLFGFIAPSLKMTKVVTWLLNRLICPVQLNFKCQQWQSKKYFFHSRNVFYDSWTRNYRLNKEAFPGHSDTARLCQCIFRSGIRTFWTSNETWLPFFFFSFLSTYEVFLSSLIVSAGVWTSVTKRHSKPIEQGNGFNCCTSLTHIGFTVTSSSCAVVTCWFVSFS